MSNFSIHIDHDSSLPKYKQIINQIADAAGSGKAESGQALPSVNDLILSLDLSRDTVFKAYKTLKNQGIIEAIPGKGYFVKSRQTRVLLFLDKYSPFKEGLYNALRKNLPSDFSIDLYFHHYNIKVFRDVLNNTANRYNYFVVMGFDHRGIAGVLNKMDKSKVLMLDVVQRAPENLSRIYQDFEDSFYNCLLDSRDMLSKYREVLYILRPETHHPAESAKAFMKFCEDYKIKAGVHSSLDQKLIRKHRAFLVVSDDDLVMIVERSRDLNYVLGKDIGLISYNDTPVKKVIGDGITVITTNFREMGKSVAEYLVTPRPVNKLIPTKLIIRNSL